MNSLLVALWHSFLKLRSRTVLTPSNDNYGMNWIIFFMFCDVLSCVINKYLHNLPPKLPELVSPSCSWHKLTFLCWCAVKHKSNKQSPKLASKGGCSIQFSHCLVCTGPSEPSTLSESIYLYQYPTLWGRCAAATDLHVLPLVDALRAKMGENNRTEVIYLFIATWNHWS